MSHHDFPAEPGICTFFNKQGQVLYVGRASNLQTRLAKHKADYDHVKSWISFFDEHYELLNSRIMEAVRGKHVRSFDRICRSIGFPLAMIESTQVIDCCYDRIDSIKTNACAPEELDLEEAKKIRSLKPPFNLQGNRDIAASERSKFLPANYLRTIAMSNLLAHYSRIFAMQSVGEF